MFVNEFDITYSKPGCKPTKTAPGATTQETIFADTINSIHAAIDNETFAREPIFATYFLSILINVMFKP